jgi:hypothetical protein
MDNYLYELYERDVLRLREEIEGFKEDDNIWKVKPGVTNSAGNLALHLVGNLNHFIGAQLSSNGYIRQRDLEFSSRNITKDVLLAEIDKVITVVQLALKNISQEDLDKLYPLEVFGQKSTGFYIMQFYGHLTYHLGQINYLKRILEG